MTTTWHIYINGLIVEDEQDLRVQLPSDLLEDPSRHEALLADILEAANSGRPSEMVNQWMNREPGVMSILEFIRPSVTTTDNTELTNSPLDTQLATVAATGLMAGFEDHVLIMPDSGFMVINEENPPTLEQAGEITRRLFLISQAAERLDEFGKWQRGSYLDSCENVFGDNFSVTQFVELSEKNYNTTITCLNTYRAFRSRRYNLSFTHHKEAHYSNLPQDDEDRTLMHRLLRISERFQLSCAEQRKLFSYARNGYDIDNLEESIDWDLEREDEPDGELIADRPALVDRVSVREANRNYLFKYQRQWYHHRGVRDALPNGATDVICTDDWKRVSDNGRTNDIPSWTPVGTPADDQAEE